METTEIITNLQNQIKLYQQMLASQIPLQTSFSAPSLASLGSSASSSISSSAPSLAPPLAPSSASPLAPSLASSASFSALATNSLDSSLKFIAKPNKAYISVKDILMLFKLKKNEYNNILVRIGSC
jgi:hypothetical protein